MEGCKEELAKARKRLQELQKERKLAEAKVVTDGQTADKLNDEAMDKDKVEADAEKVVETDLDRYKKAEAKRKEKEEEYNKMKSDFAQAESKLRHIRGQEDSEGGVYRAAASIATSWPSLLALLFSLALLR